MSKLIVLLLVSVALASISERQTDALVQNGQTYRPRHDLAYILLVVVLTLFAGLRTSYNDSLLSSKLQKNISEKWRLSKNATFSDFIEGSFL